ncbi:MAG: molybdopterin-binding protein [Coriobacteriia bacterium]|nr:molybdopterin-binding protein [Coriobacteriia bacterium]
MRDHSNHIEFTRQAAVEAMLEASGFAFTFAAGEEGTTPESAAIAATRSETVPLSQAYGRVLAADVRARVDSPTVLTCCMDSVAVHWSDFADGQTPDYNTWVRGVDWQFANTGIAMPEGFDTAVVIERVQVSPDEQHIVIEAAPSKQFAGTRAPGEKLRAGSLVATAGTTITPDVAAAIGSANVGNVSVVRKPRVAFIPTGNELMPPAVPPRADGAFAGLGKNFETNSILVKGRVEAWGGTCQVFDIVPDDPQEIAAAIHQACAQADIVVLNAGSSKGSDDWSCEQMEELGTVLFHETNHGPGHHSSFAVVDNTPVVGISGPSRGASLTLNFYLLPLIKAYLGQDATPKTAWAQLEEPFPQKHKKPAQEAKDAKKGPGESRPSVVQNDRQFFGIKPVDVTFGEDGKLHAVPAKGPDPTCTATAVFLLPSDPDKNPAVGSLIQIEWR